MASATRQGTAKRKARRERGTGSVRQLPDGRWRASLEITPDPATGDRRRVSATGRTKTEAMNKAHEKQRRADLSGIYQKRGLPTLSDWLAAWIRDTVQPRRKPKTTQTYQSMIDNHIGPAIGGVRLDRLRPNHFRLMENQIREGDPERGIRPCSSSTANLCHVIVRTALKAAVTNGLIARNPADTVQPPQRDRPDLPILSPEQAARMIRMETDPMWHLMWRLAFTTGMRQGERLGLTAGEIIQHSGATCINVRWQLKHWSNVHDDNDLPTGIRARRLAGSLWLTEPKTSAGRRLIPLPDDLARELRSYMRANNRILPDQLVFTHPDNRPIDPHTDQHAWHRALERAGLPRVRVHSARHTAATAMARAGVSDAIREAVIGHSSIAITNQVYTHVDVDMALKAVQTVETQVTDANGPTNTGIQTTAPNTNPEHAS